MPVHSDIHDTKEKSKDGARVVEDIISMAFNTAKGIHDAVRTYAQARHIRLHAEHYFLLSRTNLFHSLILFTLLLSSLLLLLLSSLSLSLLLP